MWIIRVLTMQKQFEHLDRQMEKLRNLVDRKYRANGGRS